MDPAAKTVQVQDCSAASASNTVLHPPRIDDHGTTRVTKAGTILQNRSSHIRHRHFLKAGILITLKDGSTHIRSGQNIALQTGIQIHDPIRSLRSKPEFSHTQPSTECPIRLRFTNLLPIIEQSQAFYPINTHRIATPQGIVTVADLPVRRHHRHQTAQRIIGVGSRPTVLLD